MHYVMSDIHGNQVAFDQMLSLIDLQEDDELYILGDVIDRGQDGIALLQRIMGMYHCTMLLGNHEYMMVNALRRPDNPECMRVWARNGCEPTLEAYRNLLSDEREFLLQYLEDLPVQRYLTVDEKQYILVHAAPVEMYEVGAYKYLSPTKFAVWYRYNGSEKVPEGKTVIYGHTPTLGAGLGDRKGRILHEEGKICIDCGVAYPERGGRLGCLRLEDMTEFYAGDGGQDE